MSLRCNFDVIIVTFARHLDIVHKYEVCGL